MESLSCFIFEKKGTGTFGEKSREPDPWEGGRLSTLRLLYKVESRIRTI
jgi:hypothetical protein